MSHRVLVVLTVLNLAGLVFALTAPRPVISAGSPEILRARGLQIVDEKGRVRASIAVLPESTTASGEHHPETVLLRLITERGRPSVKISSAEDEAGVSLSGPTGTKDTYIVLAARGTDSSITLRNEAGREQVVKP